MESQSSACPPPSGCSVLVTDISPKANEKTVTDFFSFCGKVTNLSLRSRSDGAEAIVTFESEGAAKTALLLTGALIVDRAITVNPHNCEDEFPPVDAPGTTKVISGDEIENRPQPNIHPNERTKTSVIASLIAAGYTVSADAVRKAREFDEERNISTRINAAAEAVGTKVKEIDDRYQISKKIEELSDQVAEKAKVVDESLHISETAGLVGATVSLGVQNISNKIKADPTINDAWSRFMASTSQVGDKINEFIAPATNSIKAEVDDISNQSKALIKEKMKERGLPYEDDEASAEYRPVSTSEAYPPEKPESPTTPKSDLLEFNDQSSPEPPVVPSRPTEPIYSLDSNPTDQSV